VTTAVPPSVAACRDVEVVYGHDDAVVHALAGVSLGIEPGADLALLGRSGSGKTTLLHVLGGLVAPTAGEVTWHGRARPSPNRHGPTAPGIAYVFQGANLLPYFTAVENVAFAAQLADGRPGRRLAPEELLELVGLREQADQLPAELSGGESQRVAIARALAQRPDLMLCDEPTGHLDSDTAERVLELIEVLRNELGFALAVATHDAGVAGRFTSKVKLEDGRIVGDGR
jgi:ABC-type lipoprotein export system ATPase subunit